MPLVRSYLIGVARAGGTVTYGELKADLDLPYAWSGLGYILDIVTVDCGLRPEASLAALVVTGHAYEVGDGFAGDAEAERRLVYAKWLSQTLEPDDSSPDDAAGANDIPVRGHCPSCGSHNVTRFVWGLASTPQPGDGDPAWLVRGGCVIEPWDARCESCGHTWTAETTNLNA